MNSCKNVTGSDLSNQIKDPPRKKNYKFNIGQIYQIEGKNCYHEFDILPLSLTDIIDDPLILRMMEKNSSKWTKEERSNFAYSFTHYYDKYFCGILYQSDKPGTSNFRGTKYKRLFRKIRNTSNFRQEISLIDAFKQLSDQRQIILGPNLSSRQIFVVDVDESFTWEKYDEIINICTYNPIPYPSCIIINREYNPNNKTQNHYQIVWILDDYFFSPFWSDSVSKELYNLINDTLTSVFNGDIHFQKLFGKNPYCTKGLETLWIRNENDPYIDFDGFIKDMRSFISTYDITNYSEEKIEEDNEINITDKYGLSEEEFRCIDWKYIYSRNTGALRATTKRVFQLKNEGKFISYKEIKELFIRYESFIARITGKYNIESNRKINATVKGILRFVNKNYDPSFKKVGKYDEKDRESSKLTKKYLSASKRLNIEIGKKKGYSQNKIANINGYSVATVSRLNKNMSLSQSIKLANEGYKYFKDKEKNSKENSKRQKEARKNKLILQFILRLYKAVCKLLMNNPSLSMINTLIEKTGKVVDSLVRRLYNEDINLLLMQCHNLVGLYLKI